jgi:hypothetical protein
VVQRPSAIVTNDSQNKGVNWALSGAGCTGAACGSVSSPSSASGAPITYTAPASVSPGKITYAKRMAPAVSFQPERQPVIHSKPPAINVLVAKSTRPLFPKYHTRQLSNRARISGRPWPDIRESAVLDKWSATGKQFHAWRLHHRDTEIQHRFRQQASDPKVGRQRRLHGASWSVIFRGFLTPPGLPAIEC